ncbi:hypothetical protein D3C81_1256700 [compost metagenome]
MGGGQLSVLDSANGRDADAVSHPVGDRYGHGISDRPVDVVRADSSAAPRTLHRVDGRLLAARLRCCRRAVLLSAAADWLARHLSGVGGAGGVRTGDQVFHSRVTALAGTGRKT